ncbi:hypothetical protein PYCCODRAFT_1441025 [Trametes coccinea BRFM310]|uniref:SUZ domain-containing protein n=1 Tax=Trametes coccinea (strain BRFM310) TaxID=1353009 RepID=A0A1Y2I5S7_TRAC3|nr:hypothetical protein PYCCODRAFT_1441025 [Trametes coccinea BRFM310]
MAVTNKSTASDSWGAPSTSAIISRASQHSQAQSAVRDDWDDDDADLPDEEDPQKLWEEANARAPMPQVVIAGSSTSNAAALSPPPAALQPVMRILKRPSASPSSSASSPGSSTANDPSASKSYAEREARYQAARERIFGESQPATETTDAQQPEGGANARSATNATPVRITREPKGPPPRTATQKDPDLGAEVRGFSSRRGAKRVEGRRDG